MFDPDALPKFETPEAERFWLDARCSLDTLTTLFELPFAAIAALGIARILTATFFSPIASTIDVFIVALAGLVVFLVVMTILQRNLYRLLDRCLEGRTRLGGPLSRAGFLGAAWWGRKHKAMVLLFFGFVLTMRPAFVLVDAMFEAAPNFWWDLLEVTSILLAICGTFVLILLITGLLIGRTEVPGSKDSR